MKKILASVFTILIIVLLVAVVGRNVIVKAAAESATKIATGLDLKIQSVHIGIRKTVVSIQGLELCNPAGFQDKIMLDLPLVYVDYSIKALLKGKIRLPDLRINMRQFTVVKNATGQLNLDALKPVQTAKPKETPKAEPAKKGKAPELQIDNLELKIGKVVYKDYSKGGAPAVTEFNININEKFQNITDPNALVRLIVFKAMSNSTIAALANFDLSGLQGTLTDTLGSSMKMAGAVGTKAADTLKQTAQDAAKVTEVAAKTTDALKKTAAGTEKLTGDVAGTAKKATEGLTSAAKGLTSGLKGTMKLPFGKSSDEGAPVDSASEE